MKIALLGRGKTGSKVLELAEKRGHQVICYHRSHPPELLGLKEADVIISFLPGEALLDYIDLIISAGTSIISGSTGKAFPSDLGERTKKAQMLWVQGHNFSLGMNLVHRMIQVLNKAPLLYDTPLTSKIHEIHHTQKLDAPSGTALRWKEWLGLGDSTAVTSERTGDVVGFHQLEVGNASEKIILTHEALDRSLFAEGALWAAGQVYHNKWEPGFHWFEDLALKELL